MKKISFKEWLKLNETGTSTGDVAGFQRRLGSINTRQWASMVGEPWTEEDPFFKKNKKKKS